MDELFGGLFGGGREEEERRREREASQTRDAAQADVAAEGAQDATAPAEGAADSGTTGVDTIVEINGQQFDLHNMSTERGLELYAALPPEYQEYARTIERVVMEYEANVNVSDEGRNVLFQYADLVQAGSRVSANALSGAASAAVNVLRSADTSGTANTVLDALGAPGSFIDGALGTPVRAVSNALGGVSEVVDSALSSPVSADQARAFAAAYAAAMYEQAQDSGREDLPFFSMPFSGQNALIWKYPAEALGAVTTWATDFLANIPFIGALVPGLSALLGTIGEVFGALNESRPIPDLFQTFQSKYSEAQTGIETRRGLSIEQILEQNITNGERNNVAATLMAADTIAGIDTQDITQLLKHGGVYRTQDGRYRIVRPENGTISEPVTQKDASGNDLTRAQRATNGLIDILPGTLRNGYQKNEILSDLSATAGVAAFGAAALWVAPKAGRMSMRALHGANVARIGLTSGFIAGMHREMGITKNFYGNLGSRFAHAVSFGRFGSKNTLAMGSVQRAVNAVNVLEGNKAALLSRRREVLATIDRLHNVTEHTKRVGNRIAHLETAAAKLQTRIDGIEARLHGGAGALAPRNLNPLRLVSFPRDSERWLTNGFGHRVDRVGDLNRALRNSNLETFTNPTTGYTSVGKRGLSHVAADVTAQMRAVAIPLVAESNVVATLATRSGANLISATRAADALTRVQSQLPTLLNQVRSDALRVRVTDALSDAVRLQQEAVTAARTLAEATGKSADEIARLAQVAAEAQARAASKAADFADLNRVSGMGLGQEGRQILSDAARHVRVAEDASRGLATTADEIARVLSTNADTAAEAVSLVTRDVVARNPELLRMLTPERIVDIPTNAWSGLTETTIRNIPAQSFVALSAEALQKIPDEAWRGIPESQIADLAARLNAEDAARVFNANMLAYIEPAAVRHVPASVLSGMTEAQARQLPSEVVEQILARNETMPRNVTRVLEDTVNGSAVERGMSNAERVLNEGDAKVAQARRPVDQSLQDREVRRARATDKPGSVHASAGAGAAAEAAEDGARIVEEAAEIGTRSLRATRVGMFGARALGKALRFIPFVGSAAVLWSLNTSNAHASEGMDREMSPSERLQYDRDNGIISEAEYLMYRGLQGGQIAVGALGPISMVVTEGLQNGANQVNPTYLRRYLDPSMADTVMELVNSTSTETPAPAATSSAFAASSGSNAETQAQLQAEAVRAEARATAAREEATRLMAQLDRFAEANRAASQARVAMASRSVDVGAIHLAALPEHIDAPNLVPDSMVGGLDGGIAPVRLQ